MACECLEYRNQEGGICLCPCHVGPLSDEGFEWLLELTCIEPADRARLRERDRAWKARVEVLEKELDHIVESLGEENGL